jgi:hypothetical protein
VVWTASVVAGARDGGERGWIGAVLPQKRDREGAQPALTACLLLGKRPGGVVMMLAMVKALRQLQSVVVARGDARRVGACFCWAN